MALSTIDHIAIQSKDVKRSVAWYQEHYSCSVCYIDDTWALLQFANIKLAIVSPDEHPAHVAILAEKIRSDPKACKHRDGSFSFYIQDPDENMIEMIEYSSASFEPNE